MRRPTQLPSPAWALMAIAVLAGCSTGTDRLTRPDAATESITSVSDTDGQIFTTGDDPADDSAPTSAPTITQAPETTATTATTATTTLTAATTIAPTTTAAAPTPLTTPAGSSPCPPTGQRVWDVHPASDIPAPAVPEGWRTESAGTSVQGRDLTVLVRPVDTPARTVMVIGGIHGNEPVSPPTVRAMVDMAIPDDTELWLLPLLNPDGSEVGTRCNANGVDLNRNFSWEWRADDGGPEVFSEPESAAAAALVERVDPDLVVWVHQPLGYVSSIGNTPDSYEQAWADPSGVPVRPDVSQHGGGESWTAFVAGLPSMLIEVDSYEARPDMVASHIAGFVALLDVVVPR